ncbi:hypothetical protein [Ilumatobacter sp.]|uniref:hypothetical protein n=1 Tax=Ilumatobacter sp. TaxID=1967498 RepID=UPI003C3D8511
MNVFNTLFAVRPEVDPMPIAERSRIRESLFGVGHDDTTRTVRARSESGAVVSTAPHGTRAIPPRPKRSIIDWVRRGAGLVAVIAVGVVVWSLLSDDDANDAAEPTEQAVGSATESTASPTTTATKLRTPVTASASLLVPEEQIGVDEVEIAPSTPGASTMLVSMPDGSSLWVAEIDGDPASVDGLEFDVVGSIGVGVPTDPPEGAAPTYQFFIPCGLAIASDTPGMAVARPEVTTLFESMSIDSGARIEATLPEGYSVLDIGDGQDSYTAQFQVPVDGATATVRLTQIPDGALGQLTFGGRQLESTTFLDQPAFVDAAPTDPDLVSLFWQDASTVFNLSSTELDADGLASFTETLTATTPEEWSERFTTPAPPQPTLESTCTPQPTFGPTLNP